MAMQSNFTKYFKKRRMELGFTTRKFAEAKGYDAGYISRLENGIMMPPGDHEKIANLAKALEIKEGSDEWTNFFDMVALARNEVPEDLRSDETILKILPAFYRGAREKTLSKEDVEKLVCLFEDARKE